MNLIKGYNIGEFISIIADCNDYQYNLMIKITDEMLYKTEKAVYLDIHSHLIINEVRQLTGLKKEAIRITILNNSQS